MQLMEGGLVGGIPTGALGDLGVTTRATVANKMMRFISATSFIRARLTSPAALRNRASMMIFVPARPLYLSGLHVERDVHRFDEGQVDRATLPPSLVKLLHITFAIGRLDPDVEPDVVQVRLGASHAKEAARICLTLRRSFHCIDADAELRREGVTDEDHRAAG
jgi:hypothetical protein